MANIDLRMNTIQHKIAAVLLVLLFLVAACAQKEKLQIFKTTRVAMYTIATITVVTTSQERADAAIEKVFDELKRLEGLLNFYSEESELSLVNRNAGIKPVKVSPTTFEAISLALSISKLTDGAFDPTVGPMVKLWNFKEKKMPTPEALKEKMQVVGYKNVLLNEKDSTVFLKIKGAQIDLGGSIKGYAADKAVEVLKKNGIQSGIVAIAGDIKAFGTKPDGSLWRVGIKNPRPTGKSDEIMAAVTLKDKAISTSGDYERFFEKDGKWYHHLLDPKTGYPVYDLRSVTVIADKAVYADALSTGIFILGPQRGMEVLKKKGFDGILVDNKGAILTTEAIKQHLEFNTKQ